MPEKCLQTFGDIVESRGAKLSWGDLVFVPTQDLVKALSPENTRKTAAHQQVFMRAELLVRALQAPRPGAEVQATLSGWLDPGSGKLENLRHELGAIEGDAWQGERGREVEETLRFRLADWGIPEGDREVVFRRLSAWLGSDGFIPVCSVEGPSRAVLVPFRFEEDSGPAPLKVCFEGGGVHEKWTEALGAISRHLDIRDVRVVLGIGCCDVAGNSFMLPVAMAWWRHKGLLKYNPLRVFATGELADGHLKKVIVQAKRDMVRAEVDQSLLISPSYDGEYGELDESSLHDYGEIRSAIGEILKKSCPVDVFLNGVRNAWESCPRVAGHLFDLQLDFERNHPGQDPWVWVFPSFRGLVGASRFDNLAIGLLGAICSLLNSQDGGLILLGMERRGEELVSASLSDFLPEDEDGDPCLDAKREEWPRGELSETFRQLFRGGTEWNQRDGDGVRVAWRLACADGAKFDVAPHISVVEDVYRGRPVLIVSVKPALSPLAPLALHRAISFPSPGGARVVEQRFVCGGRSPSRLPELSLCHEWGIRELAEKWPRSRSGWTTFFKSLLDDECKTARKLDSNRALKARGKILRALTDQHMCRLGLDVCPILAGNAQACLDRLSSGRCWVLGVEDADLGRRVFSQIALASLALPRCCDEYCVIPLVLDSGCISGQGGFLVELFNILVNKVPRLDFAYPDFLDAVEHGRYRLMVDLTALKAKEICALDLDDEVRNLVGMKDVSLGIVVSNACAGGLFDLEALNVLELTAVEEVLDVIFEKEPLA